MRSAATIEKDKARGKAKYWANPDQSRAENRRRRRERKARDPEGEKVRQRFAFIKMKYGLTPIEWEQMFEAQGRCCAMCKRTHPGSRYWWTTDHNHATGKVRGILCWRCNTGLGYLEDHEFMTGAKGYLEKHK